MDASLAFPAPAAPSFAPPSVPKLRLTTTGWLVAGTVAALGAAAVWNSWRGRAPGVTSAANTLVGAASSAVDSAVSAAGSIAGGAGAAANAVVGAVANAAGAVTDAAAGVVSAVVPGKGRFNTGAIALAPRPRDTLMSAAARSSAGEPMGALVPPGAAFSAPSSISASFGALADLVGGSSAIRHAPANFKPVALPGPRRAVNFDPRGPPDVDPSASQPAPCQISDFAPTRPVMQQPVAALTLGPA